ncbi:MAG: hypothetical protein R3A52_25470 [Polyangiales bacterium]
MQGFARWAVALSLSLSACGAGVEVDDVEPTLDLPLSARDTDRDLDRDPPAIAAHRLARPGNGPRSRWVHWGSDGSLVYDRTARGDRVPDFSYAGYGGGGVALPRVDAVVRLSPSAGDDTRRIQDAIDRVGRMPRDRRGFRGAVELRAGRFQVSDTLRINRDGVVLRGAGAGPNGTVLYDTRRQGGQNSKPTTLEVAGRAVDRMPRTERNITDRYVPSGTSRVTVRDASDLRVGDRVVITRRWTQSWIDRVGMDACNTRGTRYDTSDRPYATCIPGGDEWRAGREMHAERAVRALRGDEVVLDAPLTFSIDDDFGGATLARFDAGDRVSNVGVEKLRGDSFHRNSTDEDHAWHFIEVHAAEDVWVRDVTAEHFARSAVVLGNGAVRVTVQDSAYINPVSEVSGGRRYAFDIDGGQFVLVQRCRADHARHAFVTGSTTMGPNVFLQCEATRSYTSSEMHSDWSTGLLYDRVREHEIQIHNENRTSDGHGWGGAESVLWNVTADALVVASPPTSQNWVIGARVGRRGGDAYWDETGHAVEPGSLYLAQLRDRLGQAAVDAVAR